MTNMEWIAQGNTGCTFATLFARKPASIGWTVEKHNRAFTTTSSNTLIHSIEFPHDWTNKMVRKYMKDTYAAFYEVDVDEECLGLRIDMCNAVRNDGKYHTSWVQYFGPDSHVVTRQSPTPMLMYTRRLNPLGYFKQVGFTGILHLAHAFSKHLTERMVNTLWQRSYEQVSKKIGHKPTIKEAAKTTWLKKDLL